MTAFPSVVERVAVPFVKWAGGKSVIADKIVDRLGALPPGATYFEPFLGGGAVFFRLRPAKAVLLDSNVALIRTYLVVRDRVDDLLDALKRLPAPKDKEEYERRRDAFNALLPAPLEGALTEDDVRRAALLIWLNHTCYNGLYRVNKSGEFNVPFGYAEDAFIYDEDNLRAASAALRNTQLVPGDYSSVVSLAKRGDVLYFDPPYQPPDEGQGFTAYTAGGFGPKDQARLAAVVHELLLRGARPVVSNSNAADITELYVGLECRPLMVPRAINCNGAKRGRVVELLFFPKTRKTLHDLWETVVDRRGFDLATHAIFEVTSRQVKQLTGQEPRLVAKMDTREELPHLFQQAGYFVLPVSTNKYALVPGDGYHNLEGAASTPKIFHPARDVPITVALKAGESAAVQTALYSGLLEQVVGVPRLRETLHNDKIQLRNAKVRYGDAWTLAVDGAQVELDAGFENHEEFFLFECKNWYASRLRNFNVRQLFFPYLHVRSDLRARNLDWNIRCFFLNVEPDTAVYRFWEYRFPSADDYSSIRLVRRSAFKLAPPESVGPHPLLQLVTEGPVRKTDYVPQADDPTKLLALVQGVAEGVDTPSEVARRLRFVGRQSQYYGEAAEELGLIERARGRFALTTLGSEVAAMQTDGATHALIERIFTLPVFHEIAERAVKRKSAVTDANSVLALVREIAARRYSGSTVERRAQSVQSWLNWIGETTGSIRVRPTPRPPTGVRSLDEY